MCIRDRWHRLERFLILGSDSNTYYQHAKALTRENAGVVMECWAEDPHRTATVISDISFRGRAAKQDPAFFALALGVIHDREDVRAAAFSIVPHVCRTASHLFEWVALARQLGKGWGRSMKRAVADWYASKPTDKLAYQMIKYRSRAGLNHKLLIELSHKGAGEDWQKNALYRWVRGRDVAHQDLPDQVVAHIDAMQAPNRHVLMDLVTKHRLPWEAIPTSALNDPGVWKAMLPNMPLTAMIRNLGNMTACGAIGPMDHAEVSKALQNEESLKRARVHPFTILQALAVYKSGQGVRGDKSWQPVTQVIDALDGAFYKAFSNVEPTGKRILIGLDTSSSMNAPMMGSPLRVSEASAAMCLVTLATEANTHVVGFTGKGGRAWAFQKEPAVSPLNISARQRLDDVVSYVGGLTFGRTDCSLPMLYAMENGLDVDAFVIYTDNETWCGNIHPFEALKQYRRKTGINARLIVVAMTSTGFTIADPDDAGMLDMVGFDSSGPALISDFIKR